MSPFPSLSSPLLPSPPLSSPLLPSPPLSSPLLPSPPLPSPRSDLARSLNTDEAVALGAVYQAAALSKGFRVKTFLIKDANTFPVEVRVMSSSGGNKIALSSVWGMLKMTLRFVKLPNLLKGVSLSMFKWSSCWSKALLVGSSYMAV